jgi:FkbM family methyltransferase
MRYFGLQDVDGVRLDKKLDEVFQQKTNGFFVELGANDGMRQSNTAFFEFFRGWRGVLVEPSPQGFQSCKIHRPNSRSFHAACVSPSFSGTTVEGDFTGDLMSSVDGKRLGSPTRIQVPAKTLTSILDAASAPASFDLLSLDTEGYELAVLEGLDLNRYRPHFMVIEIYTWDFEAICGFLQKHGYELVCNFSGYTKERHPPWDGTHNDYLFRDLRDR